MGLKATCQDGHITISDGDIIVKRWFMRGWKEWEEEARRGGDYVETKAHRRLRNEDESSMKEPILNTNNSHEQPQDQGQTVTEESHEKGEKALIPSEEKSQLNIKDGFANQIEGSDVDAVERKYKLTGFYENKSYIAARKVDYAVSWHGYWNKTLKQLDEEFKTFQTNWNKSKECIALIAQLKDLRNVVKLPVTNIVALSIGSLHDCPRKGIQRRTGEQLAAVITIREALGETGKPLPCVIQDPASSELEKEYLHFLGLDAVDDPDAFSRINDNSLVLHIGSYFFIAWWICDGTWPTAMVCSDWGNADPHLTENHPAYCIPRVHAMFQEYDFVPFIDDGDRTVSEWGEVNLYWRKEQSSSTEGTVEGQ